MVMEESVEGSGGAADPAAVRTSAHPGSIPTPPISLRSVIAAEVPDLRAHSLYLNRELSWLEFNARVLAEADSDAVPLLERLKFHAIVASNLDEFFMVRVAGLKQHVTGEIDEIGPEGMTVGEQPAAIPTRVHELVAAQSAGLAALLPRLAEAGIVFLKPAE